MDDISPDEESRLARGELTKGAAAPANGPAKLPLIRPIDVETLLHRCQGNASLVEKLLTSFDRQVGKQLESLRQELRRRDVSTMGTLALTIKIGAAALSAEPVRAAAEDLEARILAGDFEAVAACVKSLDALVRDCVEYLPAAIADVKRPAGK